MNAKVEATWVDSPAIMMFIPVCPWLFVPPVDASAPPAACSTSERKSQATKKQVMNRGESQDRLVPYTAMTLAKQRYMAAENNAGPMVSPVQFVSWIPYNDLDCQIANSLQRACSSAT